MAENKFVFFDKFYLPVFEADYRVIFNNADNQILTVYDHSIEIENNGKHTGTYLNCHNTSLPKPDDEDNNTNIICSI